MHTQTQKSRTLLWQKCASVSLIGQYHNISAFMLRINESEYFREHTPFLWIYKKRWDGRLARQGSSTEKKMAEEKEKEDSGGQSKLREQHWKHFQGCFCWHRVRRPCCSLEMLLDDKLNWVNFRTKAGWKKRLLDVIRVSHSCLHGRENETTANFPTWPKCLSLQHHTGLSGICSLFFKICFNIFVLSKRWITQPLLECLNV